MMTSEILGITRNLEEMETICIIKENAIVTEYIWGDEAEVERNQQEDGTVFFYEGILEN